MSSEKRNLGEKEEQKANWQRKKSFKKTTDQQPTNNKIVKARREIEDEVDFGEYDEYSNFSKKWKR